MISPIDSPLPDKMDNYEIYANIDILATQAMFVMKVSPYTLKITQTTILLELFLDLIKIQGKVPAVGQTYLDHLDRDIQSLRS